MTSSLTLQSKSRVGCLFRLVLPSAVSFIVHCPHLLLACEVPSDIFSVLLHLVVPNVVRLHAALFLPVLTNVPVPIARPARLPISPGLPSDVMQIWRAWFQLIRGLRVAQWIA